jgi:hemoglobin/transferrin/lactoferrin receptor protein
VKKLFLLSILLHQTICFFSQTITIIDNVSLSPIQGVVVYSKNINLITDVNGKVDITSIVGSDTVFIRHVSYKILALNYDQLKASDFIIKMEESKISISEVIVSTNRWKFEKTEFPQKFIKIDRREVCFQNPQTSADLLGNTGYVYVQKSQLAGGSPMLRGFSTNRVLLVVDGVRMNNAIFRTGNLQNIISIDASSLQSSEVIFGPGSVMYGSDAIGGVMDFQTFQPFYNTDNKPRVTGNAFIRYASANTERTGSFDFNAGFKKWAFLSSFTCSVYNDLLSGTFGNKYFLRPFYQQSIEGRDTAISNSNSRLQKHSGYKQYNFMQKIGFKPDEALEIVYGFYYSTTSDAPRYDRLTLDSNSDGTPDYSQWYYGPQQWIMNRIAVTSQKPHLFFDEINAIVAYQHFEESRHDRKFKASSLRSQYEKVDALSLNIDLEKKPSNSLSVLYGAEFISNIIGSQANRLNLQTGSQTFTNTRYPDGSSWFSGGIYTNLKYEANSKLIINSGLRYSYYRIAANFDTSMFPFPFTQALNRNGAINGNLGFVYNAHTNLSFYLNASTGYRSPNIDDIGKVFESEPGSVVVPNAGLKPEYAYNVELGTTKLFGSFVKIDLAGFYTYLDNALARRDFSYNNEDSIIYDSQLSRVQAIQNINNAYVYGIQAGIDINFGGGFGMSGTITYQKGEEKSEEDLEYYPLRHVPPTFGATHLTYQRPKFKVDFYLNYNAGMNYNELPLSERNDAAPYAKNEEGLPYVPAWCTLNLKTAWFINSDISVNAGIENITDRLYRPFASGISAPGRNFIIALRSRF